MVENFYSIANKLDEYKNIDSPTQTEINELTQLLNKNEFVRYFFHDLSNSAWIRPLHTLNIFNKIPPPLEDTNQPGYFSMPSWYEGEYLNRMADKFPDIVKDVALSLQTDNSRAIRTMLEALTKVPVDVTAEITGKFSEWVNTPFSNFMMLAHELGILMEHLAKGGEIQAALETLAVLLEPVQVKDRFEEGKFVASTRHDYHWLNQALQSNLPILTKLDPIGVVNVAEEQLVKAIELESDARISDNEKRILSYWRLSISPKSDLDYDNEIKNISVNIIITGLSEACKNNSNESPLILSRYINSDYSIFRRITLYILQTWGQQYISILEEVYNSYKEKPIRGIQVEFDNFIETQFKNFPETIKQEILFDRKNPSSEFVEELLNNRPNQFEGETREEQRKTLIEKWHLSELSPLASYLEGNEKEYYEGLVKKYGEPSPKLESPVSVSWAGEKSPVELKDLAEKTISSVVQYLLDYLPDNNTPFDEPSIEGLANVLENDIQSRPNDYANQANLFINNDLRFIYHSRLLRSLGNVIKKQEKIELDGVIAVCEYLTKQQKEKYQLNRYEAGLASAKLAVANLFGELFKIKEPYLNRSILDRTGKILVELLNQQEPFPDDENSQNYDPATRSLNSLHGMALHSLVFYGLYCERKRKQEAPNESPVMVPLLKETLIAKLDKRKSRSLSVHSVLGWYFPQFIYLDETWAIENLQRIFRNESKMARYWQAAWSAYIRFSDVYTNVFPKLMKQYQKALEEIQFFEKHQGFDRSNEKLATHVLKAYLLDIVKLDSKDRLLLMYYQKANDETRSHGNFWLAQVLESQRPSAKDIIWQKIWDLWRRRIEIASAAENKSEFTKEISSFSRFLKNAPLNLLELDSIIEQTILFKSDGFETQEIIEFLGKHAEEFPSLAVSHLHKIVLSGQQFYLLEDTKKSVEQILTFAMRADEDAKSKAIEIINVFGERGDYSWRPLLNISEK